eukprot:gnl/MRDRNA2_/MRDRNA2_142469_c0_seq1.p1 gnl/MRDRNA2_/MRDRNA2_142469_c0~~gnl/MRDRNA2_/MRDRNA2_142469_c0_seq1.p1  ORF type:complete len:165 (+),score=27.39 gnl/MRDRNA2_/MRDRNA2_142469_c0_seq1:177-671(+)
MNFGAKVDLMGKSCPDITLAVTGGEQRGKMSTLYKMVGEIMQKTQGKTTLILFWYAHFCSKCAEMIPKLDKLAAEHGEMVKILMVNTQAADSGEDEFIKKLEISDACVRVETSTDQLGVYGVVRIPHITVIHRDGMIVRNASISEPGHTFDDISCLVKQMIEQP